MNKAEIMVFKDLREKGFVVSNPKDTGSTNGIDLIAIKNGKAITIEVKQVSHGKKHKTIKPILKSGQRSNVIAIVNGDDIIYQPMKDHLRLCGKSGTRGVTDLIKLKEMILAGIKTGDVALEEQTK